MIELLTVIAIIGVLAAILIPVVSSVRARSRSSVCQSNLRQIGAAIFLFCSDNRGLLPGGRAVFNGSTTHAGLATATPAFVGANNWNKLPTHLAPYMGITFPANNEGILVGPFACPAFALAHPDMLEQRDAAIFVLNSQTVGSTGRKPFGDAGDSRTPSLKLEMIEDPSRFYVMADVDREMIPSATWTYLAPKPVHGERRNRLFFDGRVESLPLTVGQK